MSDRDKKLLGAVVVILILAVGIFFVRDTGGNKGPLPPVARSRSTPKPPTADSESARDESRPDSRRARPGDRRRGTNRLGDDDDQVAAGDLDASEEGSETQATKPRGRGTRRTGGSATKRSHGRGSDDAGDGEEKDKKEERKPGAMGASDL